MTTLNALILMAMSVCKPFVLAFVLRQTIIRAEACPALRDWPRALSAS